MNSKHVFPLGTIDLYHAGLTVAELKDEFSEFLRTLGELNCSVEFVDEGEIPEELLIESSFVVTFGPIENKGFSLEEIAALDSFVRNGGSLLFVGNNRSEKGESCNPLLEKFGFGTSSDRVRDQKSRHGGSENLPITEEVAEDHQTSKGVSTLLFHAPSTIEVLDYSKARPICHGSISAYVSDEAKERTLEGFPVLAVASEVGSGRVVAIGDGAFLSDEFITWYDNKVFFSNVINWVLKRRHRRVAKMGRVLVYPSTGFGLSSKDDDGYYRMAWDLYTQGFNLKDTDELPEAPNTDVIMIFNLPTGLADDQRKSLLEFIREGGGLLVLFDRSRKQNVDRLNDLLEEFGIRFNKTAIRGSGDYEMDKAHPLGKEISRFSLSRPLTIELERPAMEVASWGQFGGFKCVMAASKLGQGRVVAIGDDWPFRNHDYWKNGHYEVIRASMNWLSVGFNLGPLGREEGMASLRHQLMILRDEVEEMKRENKKLTNKIQALNGEKLRIDALRRIVQIEADVKKAETGVTKLGRYNMDADLAQAVLEACRSRITETYDIFDHNPRVAQGQAEAVSAIVDSLMEVISRRRVQVAAKDEEVEQEWG